MKFVSIHLQNYIGIYNGLGLYDIAIDLTKCVHKTITIRGDNGSGKSTLMKAFSVFPDSNDSFIPGMPANKQIILSDNDVIYRLTFVHGIKSNGDRETTKAYIAKSDLNGSFIELNENGNVSSYKDIIYDELGLDPNFEALSQLSTDDRGLADKKPAERKRFVNSIISSLEVYNNIYKTLSKNSSQYKSTISSLADKIVRMGSPSEISYRLDEVTRFISEVQADKDNTLDRLGQEKSKIILLDPDGSIQFTDNKLNSEIQNLQRELDKIESTIKGIISRNGITSTSLDSYYKEIVERKNSLIIQNQIDRNKIDSLMHQKEAESEDLTSKIQRLNNIQSESSYDTIVIKLKEYESVLENISKDMAKLGIVDVSSISKEEYIMALESLKDLNGHIQQFRDLVDYSLMQDIVSKYLAGNLPNNRIDIKPLQNQKELFEKEYNSLRDERSELLAKIPILDKLNLRPSDCSNNSCGFIADALEFSNTNPKERLSEIESRIDYINHAIEDIEKSFEAANEYNEAMNAFHVLVRDVNKNASVLSKLINGEMFSDTRLFFDRLMSGYSFQYMEELYSYIDLANELDVYKQTKKIYDEYKAELKVYETKAESIDMISKDIDRINKSLTEIANSIEPINNSIHDRDEEVIRLQELEGVLEGLFALRDQKNSIDAELNDKTQQYMNNRSKMEAIAEADANINDINNHISVLNGKLASFSREKDSLSYSMKMIEEYQKEKAEVEEKYQYIEVIKRYSSPTTGIQLVFMELYMGKIIALANDLLKFLFNGEYIIQPFIINESEFKIPCLGSGYINDDISSMSSAQIGMISMILSFAMLYNSSTKYNIIKLDEIDGALDYTNRLLFLDVLNRIMDIMNTEQCIMISHNSELQVDDTDVILLKHDIDNPEYHRGNIIWSY